jgi:hypothetical protein
MSRGSIYRGDPAGGDPFLEDFFRDLPPALARSFTDEQLRAIKISFGARERGAHSVDVRFLVPVLRRYVVFLMGRERRTAKRRRSERKFHPVATIGNAFAFSAMVIVVAVPIFLAGYGIKSFMGINIMEAGGAHAVVEELRQNLVMVIKGN